MFDWFHNGEGYSAFFLQGLSDPDDRQFQVRSRRFAGSTWTKIRKPKTMIRNAS